MQLHIGNLAKEYGVYYNLMGGSVAGMVEQGRLRYVECKPGKRYYYEVADPDTYDRTDTDTHALRRKPMWQ